MHCGTGRRRRRGRLLGIRCLFVGYRRTNGGYRWVGSFLDRRVPVRAHPRRDDLIGMEDVDPWACKHNQSWRHSTFSNMMRTGGRRGGTTGTTVVQLVSVPVTGCVFITFTFTLAVDLLSRGKSFGDPGLALIYDVLRVFLCGCRRFDIWVFHGEFKVVPVGCVSSHLWILSLEILTELFYSWAGVRP